METAEHREPYESRGSRTDLGAPGGASPPSCARVAPSSADVLPEAAGFLPPAEMSSRGTGSSNPSPSRREMVWGRRRDFLPGSQEVKWRDGNPPTTACLLGFITAYNTRFGRDPANAKNLPLA